MLLARPPARLGPRTGVLVGALAYELELASGDRARSTWRRRFGFRPEVVSVPSCRSADELADLILQSSCTPVRYQIASGERSGTVRAAGAESSRRFLPYVAMVKVTDTRQSDNFRVR